MLKEGTEDYSKAAASDLLAGGKCLFALKMSSCTMRRKRSEENGNDKYYVRGQGTLKGDEVLTCRLFDRTFSRTCPECGRSFPEESIS